MTASRTYETGPRTRIVARSSTSRRARRVSSLSHTVIRVQNRPPACPSVLFAFRLAAIVVSTVPTQTFALPRAPLQAVPQFVSVRALMIISIVAPVVIPACVLTVPAVFEFAAVPALAHVTAMSQAASTATQRPRSFPTASAFR